MNETQKIFRVIFPWYNQTSKVIAPGEQALDFPKATKTSQRSSILGLSLRPTALTMWCDHFRTESTSSSSVYRAGPCRRLCPRSIAQAGQQQIAPKSIASSTTRAYQIWKHRCAVWYFPYPGADPSTVRPLPTIWELIHC